eukprot:508256-Pyramimonas_sp.AAC.1
MRTWNSASWERAMRRARPEEKPATTAGDTSTVNLPTLANPTATCGRRGVTGAQGVKRGSRG